MQRSTALARDKGSKNPSTSADGWSARFEHAIATAVARLGEGRAPEAIACVDGLKPARAPTALQATMIGLIHAATGEDRTALRWFDAALRLDANAVDAQVQRAHSLVRLGLEAEALTAFDAAFAAGAQDPDAAFAHGNLLRQAGRRPEAVAAYDLALKLRPAFPEALRAGGAVLHELGHSEAALRFLGEAIRLAPAYLDAVLDRTALLHAEARFAEALANDEAALRHLPDNALLLSNRGVTLQELGDLQGACDSFLAAVAADPALAQAQMNSGNALVWLGFPERALAAFDRALAIRPSYAEAHCGRGLTLKMLGRFDAALAAFETALAADRTSVYARANRGELHLLLGHFERGWPDYELRFLAGRHPKPSLGPHVPDWTGRTPPGARIAVVADQGNGDIIHFARYLPLLAARDTAVTFLCPARMQRLLRPLTEGLRVVARIEADEVFDSQIALSSMPFAFRTDTATMPAVPHYLVAEPDLVTSWASRLGGHGLRIGLCWRGSQNWQADPKRSIPLAALAPLAARPGLRLVSLQLPDNTGADADALAALGVEPWGQQLDRGPDAFVDTAALMASLDLIVTCDTSIAHLAGALGRPVWLLLQAVPEWRWLLKTPHSPWYPSMRLFRQTVRGDWSGPIAEVVQAIDALRDPRLETS